MKEAAMSTRVLRRIAFALCVLIPLVLLVTLRVEAARRQRPARPSAAERTAQIEAKVDPIIRAAMAEHGTPGLVLAVVDGGQVVLSKGYGVRALPSGDVPDGDTVFSIGSISKAVTAVGAMLLVEDGKIRLDDAIGKYLPALPPAWHPITIRQLMTHTSGIPAVQKVPTFAAALQEAASQPLRFSPGTDQEYNNFNFAIIGQLIEAVSGAPYLEYMQRRVFTPLRMSSTGVNVASPNRATGYSIGPKKLRQAAPDFVAGGYGVPSGGLESTLNDLLKLEAALWQQKLMKVVTYRQMLAPTIPPGTQHPWHFTPGWQRRMAEGTEVLAKNGAVPGFTSMWQRLPGRGSAVILLWNLRGKGNDFWRPSARLVQALFGVPPPGKGGADEPNAEAAEGD
jgi:CubicO group peptidase (beta-lactamase class C family)